MRHSMPRYVVVEIIYTSMELERYETQTTLSNYLSSALTGTTPQSIDDVKLPDIMKPGMKEEVMRDLESTWSSSPLKLRLL